MSSGESTAGADGGRGFMGRSSEEDDVSDTTPALDEALERMAAASFELPNGFVNHGAMACEALAMLDCTGDIDSWAHRFARGGEAPGLGRRQMRGERRSAGLACAGSAVRHDGGHAGRVGGGAGQAGPGLGRCRRAGGGGTTFPARARPAGITTSFPSLVRTAK